MVNADEVRGKRNRKSKNAGKRVRGPEVLCFMTSGFIGEA